MGVFCIYVCAPCTVLVPEEARNLQTTEGPETAVTGNRDPPCKCWELKPSHLGKQTLLLITEPLLQPLILQILCIIQNVLFNSIIL